METAHAPGIDRREFAGVRRLNLTIDHLWLAAPVFVLLCNSLMFRLPVLDFWWHLKMGELIAATRSIPHVDQFSFTAAGRPFVVQNWLADVIYYGTYRLGGFPLIVLLTSMLAVSGFVLFYALCVVGANNLKVAVFLGFLAALGNYSFSRPQTFSF